MALDRGFYHHSRSWYRDRAPVPQGASDCITVTVRGKAPDGTEVDGEFNVTWHELGGRVHARVDAFDDGLVAMLCSRDLIEPLADMAKRRHSPDPAEVVRLLTELGFSDRTSHTDDHGRTADDLAALDAAPGWR